MEQKQIVELINSKFEALQNQVNSIVPDEKEREKADLIIKQLQDFITENEEKINGLEAMQKHLDTLDIKLQQKAKHQAAHKSFYEELKEQLENKDVQAKMQKLKDQQGEFNIDLKSLPMKITGSSHWDGSIAKTEMDWDIGHPYVNSGLFELVNKGTTSSNTVTYVDVAKVAGGAAGTTEGTAKADVEYKWTETLAVTGKITNFTKISEEMLADIPFITGEIRSLLRDDVMGVVDGQLYNGNGTSGNIKGITGFAQSYTGESGQPLYQEVVNPNHLDVIRGAIARIQCCGGVATGIVLNPCDAASIDVAKDGNGQYVLPPFVGADRRTISGIPVHYSRSVTAGDFLVGDFRKAHFKIREGFRIAFGHNADDFEKNLISIRAELRGAFYIKDRDKCAFQTGTFSTVLGNIEIDEQ